MVKRATTGKLITLIETALIRIEATGLPGRSSNYANFDWHDDLNDPSRLTMLCINLAIPTSTPGDTFVSTTARQVVALRNLLID